MNFLLKAKLNLSLVQVSWNKKKMQEKQLLHLIKAFLK